MSKWTDDMVAKLQAHHRQGLTAQASGDLIGVSRCAVLGKRVRMGLVSSPDMARETVKATNAARSKDRQFRRVAIAGLKVEWVEPLDGKTLLHLTGHDCRWPLQGPGGADQVFCAARAIPDRSYCITHMELACSFKSRAVEAPERKRA